MTYRVERHLWWDATKTALVAAGSDRAAFLAYPAGTELAESEAVRLGLVSTGVAPVAVPAPVDAPEETPAEKMRAARLSNKGRVSPATKAATPDEETL